ncbi:MAG: hypothetical protein AB7Q97_09995 [Gammaproteobacteria bacterium]
MLSIGRIETAAGAARDLVAHARWHGDEATIAVAAREVAVRKRAGLEAVRLECRQAAWTAEALDCEAGALTFTDRQFGTGSGRFGWRYAPARGVYEFTLDDLAVGTARLSATAALAGDSPRASLQARRVPAAWIGTLAAYLPPAAAYSGFSGEVDLRASYDWPQSIDLRIAARELSFAGPTTAEAVTGELGGRVSMTAGTLAFAVEGVLAAGIAYIEPGFTLRGTRPGFTLEAPSQPLNFGASGTWAADTQRLALDGRLHHPGVADLRLDAAGMIGTAMRLDRVALTLADTTLAPFYETYMKPLLLGTRFDDLDLAGTLAGQIATRGTRVDRFALRFDDVHAYDNRGRFHVAGLDGALVYSAEEAPVFSELRWREAGLYRLHAGAGRVLFESQAGRMRSVEASDVPFMGGAIRIESVIVEHSGTEPRPTLRVNGGLTPVSMTELTQALGWPLMQGELAGSVRGLTYRHGTVRVDGDLDVQVFDGSIKVRGLRATGLFDPVPRLFADIDVNDLDLATLTGTFSFGRIDGRLSGHVHKLELAAWKPVYFEAELATPPDDESRHRISRRAVDELGAIGTGTRGATSQGLLRFFDSYSYDRLGLRCRLYNGWCELGGVEDTDDGFYILTRGGIVPPWIEIKGTGRRVAWKTLLEGIRTMSETKPVIE